MAADEFAIDICDDTSKKAPSGIPGAAAQHSGVEQAGKQPAVTLLSAAMHPVLNQQQLQAQPYPATSNSMMAARPPTQQYQQQNGHQRTYNANTQHLNPLRPRLPWHDGKILILFDLNGVLTDHTPARQEGKYIVRSHVVRPNIAEILRLLPHFTLGVFSSATRRTVNTALGVIHQKLREAAAAKGIEGLLVPHINSIFTVICDRSACQPDPHWRSRPDGKEWDTVKPLARQGFDLTRTILVDNDHYKSAPRETDNMFLMPHWEQEPVSDRDFPILVELLLQRLKCEMGDVRSQLEPMRQILMDLRQQEPPPQQQRQQQGIMEKVASECLVPTEQQQQQQVEVAANGAVKQQQQQPLAIAVDGTGPQQQQQQQQKGSTDNSAARAQQQQQEVSGAVNAAVGTAVPAVAAATLTADKQAAAPAAVTAANQPPPTPAAAAAAAAAAAEDRVKQLAKAKAAAEQGYKISHFVTAPDNVQQLIQVLSKYSAAAAASSSSSSSGGSSSSSPVDIQSLLGTGAAADGSSSAALAAAAAEVYKQHVSNVLLAASWATGFCVPGGFTLQQLLNAMIYRGLPTRHAEWVLDILIRRGEVIVQQPQQQQQHQQGIDQQQWQQQWPWPVDRGFWPAGGPAPPQQQQQQQQYSWINSILWPVVNLKKIKPISKSVAGVTALLNQGPTAVSSVLEGYGTKPLRPGDQGYRDSDWPQNPAAAEGEQQQQQQQQQQAAADQYPRGHLIIKHNPRLQEWRTVLFIAMRDLIYARGVMLDQIVQFVQGFQPQISQQLLGSTGQQQQQQHLANVLADLADPAAAAAAGSEGHTVEPVLQPVLGKSLGLITEPWQPAAAEDMSAEEQQELRAAAAAALVRYHCNIVPNPSSVAQSLHVLATAAAAASQQQQQQPDFQAVLDELQQQLLQPAAPVLPDVAAAETPPDPVAAAGAAGTAAAAAAGTAAQLISLLPVLNAPPESHVWFEDMLQPRNNKRQRPERKRKRTDTEASQQQQQQQSSHGDQAELQPATVDQQASPAAAADAAEDGSSLLALLPDHDQQQQQEAAAGTSDPEQRSLKQPRLDHHHHQQQQQQQQQQLEPQVNEGLQPGLASQFWLEQQQQQPVADAAVAAAAAAAGSHGSQDDGSSSDEDMQAAAAAVAAAGEDEEMQESDSEGDNGGAAGEGSSSSSDDEEAEDLDRDEDHDESSDDESDGDDGDLGGAGSSSGDGSSSSGGDDDPAGSDSDSGSSGDSDQDLGDQPDQGLDDDESSQDESDQGLADRDDPGIDEDLDRAEATLDQLCDEDHGLVEATTALADLYAADELAVAQRLDPDEEEGSGWFTDEGSDDVSDSLDDDQHDAQLQLGITGLDGVSDPDPGAAAAAAAVTKPQRRRQQLPGGRPLHAELAAAVAAAAAAQPQQSRSSSSGKSALHREVLAFSAAAAPTAVERLVLQCALDQLQAVAQQIWPTAQAVLFGSQATGLALPGSDLDVVLLGTPCPKTKSAAEGYRPRDRMAVKKLLFRLRRSLFRQGYGRESTLHVIDAKVPLCKGPMQFTVKRSDLEAAIAADQAAAAAAAGSSGILAAVCRDSVPQTPSSRQPDCVEVAVPVDLSLGVANGAAAVSFMTRQLHALPPLRPLVLVIKALLKEAGLNEVFTGGLSSYSLVNMVVAHLQSEGMTAAKMHSSSSSSGDGSLDLPVVGLDRVQQHLTQLAAAAAAPGSSDRQQQQQWDLGCLLQGFFQRFGEILNYQTEAVSVRAGGIISKRLQWIKPAPADMLLSVEDPQQYGRDISSGSRAIKEVRDVFCWASDSISRMVQYFEGTAQGQQQLAAAAAGLSCKDTAAAAAAAGSSSSDHMRRDHDNSNLTDEQMWAAVQNDSQSASVPDTVLLQHRQQQQAQQQQQQYQSGYVMLSNLINVFGALGRGAAAEAQRQQLASTAAARKAKVQQQQHQQLQYMHLHGIKLSNAAAKSGLKITALDHPHGAAAAAAASSSAGVQQVISLFGSTLTAAAAAEQVFEAAQLQKGVDHITAAQARLAEAMGPAAAAVTATAAAAADQGRSELVLLFVILEVAMRVTKALNRLEKSARLKLAICESKHLKEGGCGTAAAGSSEPAAAAAEEGRGARRACRDKTDAAAQATAAMAAAQACAAAAAVAETDARVQHLSYVGQAVSDSVKVFSNCVDQILHDRQQLVPADKITTKSNKRWCQGLTEKQEAEQIVIKAYVTVAREAGITQFKTFRQAVKGETKAAAAAAAAAAAGSKKLVGRAKKAAAIDRANAAAAAATAKQLLDQAGFKGRLPKPTSAAGKNLRRTTGISKAAMAKLRSKQLSSQHPVSNPYKTLTKKQKKKHSGKVVWNTKRPQEEVVNGVSPGVKRKQQQQQQFGSPRGSKRQRGGGGRGWSHE